MSEKLSIYDLNLIDEAYTTTYKNTFEYLIKSAESEKAKKIIQNILDNYISEGGILE